MKVNNHNLTTENIVDFIGSIFERRGDEEYLGEPVTMGQHMLQGATLAEKAGQPDEIIVAALLHDIGHFTSEFGTFTMNDTEDRFHEDAGQRCWRNFFQKLLVTAAVSTLQQSGIYAQRTLNILTSYQRPPFIHYHFKGVLCHLMKS